MKRKIWTKGIAIVLCMAVFVVTVSVLAQNRKNRQASTWGAGEKETRKEGQLWVQAGNLENDFSPLEYEGESEEDVLTLCFQNLLARDDTGRVAIKSAEEKWASDDVSVAHISSRNEPESGKTYVTIKINPKAKTAGGKVITAKDVIFNYYLRFDASAGLGDAFQGVKIQGQEEYTYGTMQPETRKKELESMLQKPDATLQKRIEEEIIRPELMREFLWVKSLYQEENYSFITSQYPSAGELFSYYYAYKTTYSPKGKTEEAVFENIVKQYGWRYGALEKITGKSYGQQVRHMALSRLLEKQGQDRVKKISGIEEVNSQTVRITVLSGENILEKVCDLWLLPLEEYGSLSQYDGQENFGYKKGEAQQICQKAKKVFRGTGAFYVKEMNEQEIELSRNLYFPNRAEVSKLRLIRKEFGGEKETVEAILKQEVDIVVVKDSQKLRQLLESQGTGAAYKIRKICVESGGREDCFLYRTSYVNATTLPEKGKTMRSFFEKLYSIKINTTTLRG